MPTARGRHSAEVPVTRVVPERTIVDEMTQRPSAVAIAGVAGLAVGAFLMLPGLTAGPSFDAAVFTAVAERLRAGDLPYVDAWDHKPPLIYIVNAIAQLLLAGWLGPWVPIWLLSVVLAATVAALIASALGTLGYERVYSALGGVMAAVVASLFVISLGGGLTEPLATAPLAAALLVSLRPGLPAQRAVMVGALCAFAVLASLMALPGVLAIVAFGWLERGRRWVGLALVGGAMVGGSAAAITAVSGALPAAFDAVLGYGAAYRFATQSWDENYGHAETAVIIIALAWAAVPASVGYLGWLRGDEKQRRLARAFALWLALTVAIPIYLGRFETHYIAPMSVPLGILAAAGVRDVVDRRLKSAPAFVLIALGWALAIGLSSAVIVLNTQALGASLEAEAKRTELAAAYVADHSQPTDRLFVWGNEPHLYYLADRRPASRFIYLLPLTTPGYAGPELIGEVLAAWQSNPPALIVDAGSFEPGSPGDPPLLIDRPVSSDGRDLDILDPLRAFVRDRYDELEIVDGWPVYTLRDPEGG